MRNFKDTILAILLFFAILSVIAIVNPSLRPIALGLINAFLILFKLNLSAEILLKIVSLLLILIAGTIFSITKKQQRILWLIITGSIEIASYLLLFKS